jgi:hypothetical protein
MRLENGHAPHHLIGAAMAAALGCGGSTDPSQPTPSRASPAGPAAPGEAYALRPGQRDVLIDLFEREFVESQEATGMTIVGTFRDLGDPDRFVWLRGFPDMASRPVALQSFYGGPVWKQHSKAANATMIDSDNVLLLHPARPGSGFALSGRVRPPRGARAPRTDLVAAVIYPIAAGDEFGDFFEREVRPALAELGASVDASFATESSPNNFPALPIREGEQVFVWLARFADRAAYDRHVAALAGSARWRELSSALARHLRGPAETRLLSPTPRSRW